jgi:hypothetical protein
VLIFRNRNEDAKLFQGHGMSPRQFDQREKSSE